VTSLITCDVSDVKTSLDHNWSTAIATSCLEDLMPLTWLPRMGETRFEHANEPP